MILNTMLNLWYVFAYNVLGWSADDIYKRYYGKEVGKVTVTEAEAEAEAEAPTAATAQN